MNCPTIARMAWTVLTAVLGANHAWSLHRDSAIEDTGWAIQCYIGISNIQYFSFVSRHVTFVEFVAKWSSIKLHPTNSPFQPLRWLRFCRNVFIYRFCYVQVTISMPITKYFTCVKPHIWIVNDMQMPCTTRY